MWQVIATAVIRRVLEGPTNKNWQYLRGESRIVNWKPGYSCTGLRETWNLRRSSHEASQYDRCRPRIIFSGQHRLGPIERGRRGPSFCAPLRPGTRARRVALDGWCERRQADRHLGQLLPDPSFGRL